MAELISNLISGPGEMKKSIILTLLLAMFAAGSSLQARHKDSSPDGECVILFSDRNLYIAGEHLLFSAFMVTGRGEVDTVSSRVLYCELITPWGGKIASGKFLIEDSRASGDLVIPADLITGTYYIRAYTRNMRNYGPDAYSAVALRIINPYRAEVQETPIGSNPAESMVVREDDQGKPGIFNIVTDKPGYTRRDTIQILIDAPPDLNHPLAGLTLAVVPEASVNGEMITLPDCGSEIIAPNYNIENRGISVTGKVTDTVSGRSLPYTRVNLSILGKGRDFMSVQTDTSGRFYFLLPDYTGNRDLFICAAINAGPNVALLVDNDFCSVPVSLPSGMPGLSAREREAAYEMAVNMQLRPVFYYNTTDQAPGRQEEERAFYGTPDDIIEIDDYIELPTLEEYFNGLPALVRIRKTKSGTRFRMITGQVGLDNFEPLVLIDLVAIDDPEQILAINPLNLSRIEVVNRLYLKGDETFGGIISLISRHGDFAGIDLPGSGVFITYGFLSPRGYSLPASPAKPNLPDTRNTLFWDPDLKLGSDRRAHVTLNAADMTGTYCIVLAGITSDGRKIRESRTFEVTGD